MSINVGVLKRKLIEIVGPEFMHQGFSFSKSKFRFTKKIGNNTIQIYFIFYDYIPDRVELTYFFIFTIYEIGHEMAKCCEFLNLPYRNVDADILLSEGDFHPEVKGEIRKFRGDFSHKIYNIERDLQKIVDCKRILIEEIWPILPQFSDLKLFQQFILDDYNRAFYLDLTISGLFAAKLADYAAFRKLFVFFWNKLELESKDERHLGKKRFSGILEYAEHQHQPSQEL